MLTNFLLFGFDSPQKFDESAEFISDAFIEAVASIVLQTAIRRFLAIRMAKILRMASRNQPFNTSPPSCSDPIQSGNRALQAEVSALTFDQEQPTARTDPVAQENFFYDLAAIQIQSVFRGWWVRDSINVDQ
jgi:IQ calmodulin-binding motif